MGGWGLYSYTLHHTISYLSSLSITIKHDKTNTFDHLSLPQKKKITSYLQKLNTQLNNMRDDNVQIDDIIEKICLPNSYDALCKYVSENDIDSIKKKYSAVHICYHKHMLNELKNVDDSDTVCRYRNILEQHASIWVNTIPTSEYTTLGDNFYRTAARRRLGLSLFATADISRCNMCNSDNAFDLDREHYLDCVHGMGALKMIRY